MNSSEPEKENKEQLPIEPETEVVQQPKNRILQKKLVSGLVVFLSVIGIAVGIGYGQYAGVWNIPLFASVLDSEMFEGRAVAVVNGEKITQQELNSQIDQLKLRQQVPSLAAEEGQVELERTVLETMIGEKLLLQDAKERGITASTEEVDAELSPIKSQFESEELFRQELNAQLGITEDEFRKAIETQLVAQRYLESRSDYDFTVTEEEVQAFYDQQTEGIEDAPPLETVESQIQSQLRQQKVNLALDEIFAELREKGEVKILL